MSEKPMLPLGGDWFLDEDEYQWIVVKRSIGQSGASEGQPLFKREAFFTDEKLLARYLPRRLSREPQMHSWLEKMESLTAEWERVTATLKRVRELERQLERRLKEAA